MTLSDSITFGESLKVFRQKRNKKSSAGSKDGAKEYSSVVTNIKIVKAFNERNIGSRERVRSGQRTSQSCSTTQT